MQSEVENVELEEIEDKVWEPKENDSVFGKLFLVEEDAGNYKCKLYHLQTKKGITKVWGTKVLDQLMTLVERGQYVKIMYLGERDNGTKLFKVARGVK